MEIMKITSNKYDKYIFILIVSLVFGGYGGSLQVVRVLSILFLPALLSKYSFCKDYIKRYYWFVIAFLMFCVTSLIWTPDKEQAAKELLYYIVHFLLFFEILVFSRFANRPLSSISLGWVICVGLTLVIAIWEISTGNHLSTSKFDTDDVTVNLGTVLETRPFAAVTFINYNGYVTFLCFALPFLFYFLLQNKDSFIRLLMSIVILLSTIGVVLINASRGGLISVLVMALIFFLMTKRSVYKTLVLVVAAIFVVYYIIPQMDTLFLGLSVKSQSDVLYTDDVRLSIWDDALKVLYNYMFVGTGIGGMNAAMKEISTTGVTITHNMFLEVLVQYGVFFMLLFILYLLDLYKKARGSKDKSIKTMLYMALFSMPVYGIIDSGYLLSPVVFTAFACFTVVAYIKKIKVYPNNKGY